MEEIRNKIERDAVRKTKQIALMFVSLAVSEENAEKQYQAVYDAIKECIEDKCDSMKDCIVNVDVIEGIKCAISSMHYDNSVTKTCFKALTNTQIKLLNKLSDMCADDANALKKAYNEYISSLDK